jgi:hypothetical protein
MKLDIGGFGHWVDGQEHVDRSLTQSQFGTVDVNVGDLYRSQFLRVADPNVAGRKTRNTVSQQAAMQARADHFRNALFLAPHYMLRGNFVHSLLSTITSSSAGGKTEPQGRLDPMRISVILVRQEPYRLAKVMVLIFDL